MVGLYSWTFLVLIKRNDNEGGLAISPLLVDMSMRNSIRMDLLWCKR